MLINKSNGIAQGAFKLTMLDLDKECDFDLKTGRGMIITEVIKDKKSTDTSYNEGGIRSSWFYSEMHEDDAFKERYSCKCEYLQGSSHDAAICPYCGEPVKLVDINLNKFGWIKLKNYKIIHPALYQCLDVIFGEKNKQSILANIIKSPRFEDTDANGNPLLSYEQEKEFDKDQPYKMIGMIEFQKRFDEILEFYANKNKRNVNIEGNVDFIKMNRDKLFISSIPVFTSALRFSMIQNEIHFVNGADKIYNMIFSSVSRMNKSTDLITVDKKLPYIQKKLNELYEMMFEKINKKDGFIKSGVIAGRSDYTSRNVIKSNPYLAADEIILSYLSFMELYKFEIINMLSKTQNITEGQAFSEWYQGTITFSDKIYEIIKIMISRDETYCLINRNPSIDWGSILQMKIVDVTHEIDNLTMSLPLMVLNGFNADFDGDNLNICSLKTKEQIRATRKYNHRLNFMVSHDHGLLHENSLPIKDLAVGLSHFCKC